jgi:hypothetical protein
MENAPFYSLAEIDQFLPVANRILMLRWLKEAHSKAEDAMDYGFEGATIIQKGDFVVTAEELHQLVDLKRGRIGPRGAALLIRMIEKEVLPSSLLIHGKEIDPGFYEFAFPSRLHQSL